MVLSMTGYGRAEQERSGRDITVEIKSVNSRYFEYTSRMPRSFAFLDDKLKKLVNATISRGKTELAQMCIRDRHRESDQTGERKGETMRDVRIQKVLAEQGVCSRRAAEQLIREGRVKLNGRPVTVGDKMDTLKDLLTVDGQKVYVPKKSEKYYYMMYKPRGYITTTNDERGRKTVMDLIADVPVRVYPVGRLDKDSDCLLYTSRCV